MKYPIETIPTFTNLSKLYVNLVITAIVVVAFCLFGYFPPIQIVQLPIYIILMFLFFNAWSLFAGLISAISKDFANLVKSFNIAVFWLSGILWNIENVADSPVLYELMMMNPVTFLCYGYRNCFVNHKWFFENPESLGFFIGWYLFLGFLSLWAHKKLRKEIPDVL
jgi:ABC-type polysaccharide/polyol phosphate export permease